MTDNAKAKPEPVELQKIVQMIVDKFADKPDDHAISIGDWHTCPIFGEPMKEFRAYLRIDLGDWRKYAALPAPVDAWQACKDAGRVMMSAHASCPTEMSHPDRMRWMADYFLKNYKPAQQSGN